MMRRRRKRANAEETLQNAAALIRFTDSSTLPPFPAYRRKALLRARWRAFQIPSQRPRSED